MTNQRARRGRSLEPVQELVPLRPVDLVDLQDFLSRADLTVGGLDVPSVRLWLLRDEDGRMLGSTGYELSGDRRDVLVRSVAVDPDRRARGLGLRLGRFALEEAVREGARRAWLFSRRSGPFWQRLGFEPADRDLLAQQLAGTHQVQLFRRTGQIQREVAWSRALTGCGEHVTRATSGGTLSTT